MQLRTQILGISVAVVLVLITWRLIHLRRLREEHSMLWFLAALVLLGLSIFKGTLAVIADFFAVPAGYRALSRHHHLQAHRQKPRPGAGGGDTEIDI